LGFIGHAEIVDVWLTENVGADPRIGPGMATQAPPYQDILQAAAPPGLTIVSVEQVDALGPALQTQVTSADYEVTLLDPVDEAELAKRLATTLKAESLPRERRGKTYNLCPLIEGLSILPATLQSPSSSKRQSLGASSRVPGEDQGMRVFMRLAARQGATGRPEEVLDVLGIPFESTRIERTRLILKSGIE
jgi:hypothetical protein